MIGRILVVVKKEFIQLRRDPKFLRLILLAPILQLFVFGYVATTDVNDIYLAVYDSCRTADSRDIIDSFINTGYFELVEYLNNYNDIDEVLDGDKADAVIVIPPDFSRDLKRNRTAKIQMIINGVNSNNAAITFNYATNIIFSRSEKILNDKLSHLLKGKTLSIQSQDRVWFNPELKSANFMVPGIISLILMIMLVPVTSMSIVREKEQGTIEQLNITPLRPFELIIGKVIPFIIIGYIDITVITLFGTLWFKVPFRGSLLMLYLFSGLFIVASLGLGIFISSISENMIQAFMGSIFFILPNMLLSGFIFPISSMPPFLQYFTYILPIRYFLTIIRGIFLKASTFFDLLPEAFALLIFASLILWIGIRVVKKSSVKD